MKRWISDFSGTDIQGYGLEICGGKHYKTPEGEFVEMKHGQEYSVKVVNYNTHRCCVRLDIDGYSQGVWQFAPQAKANIERPVTVAKKFTFYRVKHAPSSSGIQKGKAENGLVSCIFTPEKYASMIRIQVSQVGVQKPPVQFKMFGKASYSDFMSHLSDISRNHFENESLDDKMIIQWESNDKQSFIKEFIDISRKNEGYLCESGYREDYVYSLSVVPEIKSIHLKYKGDSCDHNVLSKCITTNIVKMVKQKWSLSSFYLLLDDGTPILHSTWDVRHFHVFQLLNREVVTKICKTGVLCLTVSMELPSSTNFFDVSVLTLTGKTISILINELSTVFEMKLKIQMKEGIPVDQMRLVGPGVGQMANEKRACDYPPFMQQKTMHLVLRLRGGGVDPSLEIGSTPLTHETGPKTLNANDPSWKAGATTLGKKSGQTFMSAPAMSVDERKAVTLSVRLVARDDELSEAEYQDFVDVECTPLASAVPPPVSE